MKKWFLLFNLFIVNIISGQIVSLSTFASGGNSINTPVFSNSFTIGELAIVDTYIASNFTLTQGFQQPEINIEAKEQLVIPNGITPNGDGVNDYWEIPALKSYENSSVKIFNRWGQELFSSENYTQPWNGTFNGKPLPVADYYYIIILNNDNNLIYTGTITIKK